jgi:hypothetical protein
MFSNAAAWSACSPGDMTRQVAARARVRDFGKFDSQTALSPCCSKRPLSTRSQSAFAMQLRVTCYEKSVTEMLPGGWVLDRVFRNGYFYPKKRGGFPAGGLSQKKLHKQTRTSCLSTCSAPCTSHEASALMHKVGHGAMALGQQLVDGDGLHTEELGCLTAGERVVAVPQ